MAVDPVSDPILSVRDLRVSFRHDEGLVKALDGVSLDIHPARTLGIVGESGCGKSVTARAVMRILDPAAQILSGQVLLRSELETVPQDLLTLPADGRQMRAIRGGRIGLIFQEPMTSLSPLYTIGSQIREIITKHRGMKGKAARELAVHCLHEVGIPHPAERIDQYPFQLSGGLRQRVMIAMALAGDPQILIADEPTTALDVTTQAQILDLLRRIQQRNRLALVLITHDMGVVAEMSDDVAVMYLGRVVEQGPVDRIFHDPVHPYTRLLLRSIPDVRAAPKSRLPTIAGSVPHPYRRPSGCPFHPRCPDVLPGLCETTAPTEIEIAPQTRVSCYRVEGGQ